MTARTEDQADLDVIVPETAVVDAAGVRCRVRRVKTRELFALARILTNGAGRALQTIDFGSAEAQEQVIAAVVMAIPEAPDETVSLVKMLLVPEDPLDKKLHAAWQAELDNPDPALLLELVEVLAEQEKDTISLLVGKVTALAKRLASSFPPEKRGSTGTPGTGNGTPGRAPST